MESEPNLVNVLNLLQIDILNYKSQLDIVDCSLGIVSLVNVSLVSLGYHILCCLLSVVYDMNYYCLT